MIGQPALSVHSAVEWVRHHRPQHWHTPSAPLARDHIAVDFAQRFAGVPATSSPAPESVVQYRVDDCVIPVLLGLYGCGDRVRGWLPGLPDQADGAAVDRLLHAMTLPATKPKVVRRPPCQAVIQRVRPDLSDLPALITTPRDAGPFVTMGLVYAQTPDTGTIAVSVHRLRILDSTRLTIWMVPNRRLLHLYHETVRRAGRLPVSVNIGAPPAVMVASAVNSRFLPPGASKLAVAGALAAAPITLGTAVSQPVPVLAESEIVLEGYLDGTLADETAAGRQVSMPEFLGYDGEARAGLPVLTVTAVTHRSAPVYQAVIGPGREQSTILGLGGALSIALSGDATSRQLIHDVHLGAAGGGMLLLAIAVRKRRPADDGLLKLIARRIFDQHRFVKLIVFTDDDIDISSSEDLMWAVTTRSNLSTDCTSFATYPPLSMDPSQRADWTEARGADGASQRTFIDATIPAALRDRVTRSFPIRSDSDRPTP